MSEETAKDIAESLRKIAESLANLAQSFQDCTSKDGDYRILDINIPNVVNTSEE